SHTAANLDERNDVVCRRKELLQLGDRLLERIFEVFHKSSELLSTSIDPGLRMSRVCLPFEVRRDLREYAVPISTIKCFNQAPDGFHILLRHRPRSIPQAHEPARASCSVNSTAWRA